MYKTLYMFYKAYIPYNLHSKVFNNPQKYPLEVFKPKYALDVNTTMATNQV